MLINIWKIDIIYQVGHNVLNFSKVVKKWISKVHHQLAIGQLGLGKTF